MYIIFSTAPVTRLAREGESSSLLKLQKMFVVLRSYRAWQKTRYRLFCGCVLLFFQWSCSHDVYNETGSAGRVSRLVTVLTDPFTRPTALFPSEWVKCQPGNTQNGGTVLPIAESESGNPDLYLSFLVTKRPSRLVLEIFACNRWTSADHCYSCPPHCSR